MKLGLGSVWVETGLLYDKVLPAFTDFLFGKTRIASCCVEHTLRFPYPCVFVIKY